MFDDEVKTLIKHNSNIIEVQAQILEHNAQKILQCLEEKSKHRLLNNLVNMKKTLDRINAKFNELRFLVD